jgi:transcriptional regulator with XRE-family HTH domain
VPDTDGDNLNPASRWAGVGMGVRLAKGDDFSELVQQLLDGIAGRMEDVATEAGVSYSALYSWATGRRRPGRRNLEKLAALADQRSERLARLAERLREQVREERPGGA